MDGHKVDETLYWKEGLLYPNTKEPVVEGFGSFPVAPAKGTDWSGTIRAWSQEPELTVEERLRALEA